MQLDEHELRTAWKVFHEAGSRAEAARRLGIAASTLDNRLERAVEKLGPSVSQPHVRGRVRKMKTRAMPLPKKGRVSRYIVTCAQNNTFVHPEVWENLQALADHYSAEVLVSRFTYDKGSYGKKSVKPGKAPSDDDRGDLWFAPEIHGFVCDERVELAPGLVFCGELQIEPTARRPLSGFESYTGRKSTIIPHTTVAMESIASGKEEATKLVFSTGTVTQMNYIQKRAGLRAEHHHSFGGLLVEVDSDGVWFVRQLRAGDAWEIQDLDVLVKKGKVTTGNRVEAITWGDAHAQRSDDSIAWLCWGDGGMVDVLRPKEQHIHDILDFESRSHHDMKDPFRMLKKRQQKRDSVSDELKKTADLLKFINRKGVKSIVVKSNHDRHLERWLAETDWRQDLVNANVYLSLALRLVSAINGGVEIDITASALESYNLPPEVQFLDVDESHVICKDHDGGIECGMHGDLGPNGSRGSPLALSRMGRRANTGHTHSAAIVDGVYVAGTSSQLDMGYNKGPSSWSHSHVVTYPNGERAMVTMFCGKWRA